MKKGRIVMKRMLAAGLVTVEDAYGIPVSAGEIKEYIRQLK